MKKTLTILALGVMSAHAQQDTLRSMFGRITTGMIHTDTVMFGSFADHWVTDENGVTVDSSHLTTHYVYNYKRIGMGTVCVTRKEGNRYELCIFIDRQLMHVYSSSTKINGL